MHPDALSSIIQKTITEENEEGVFISTSPRGSTSMKACAVIRYPKVKITGASNAKDLAGVGCEGEECVVRVRSVV